MYIVMILSLFKRVKDRFI